MKNNKNIEKTIKFLREQYEKSNYYRENKYEKDHRFEHSLRVANIGIEIAKHEKLDVEALALGCILHDISYINQFNSEEDWVNHGRASAKIARPYLRTLKLPEKIINEICYGIAIHVDDNADFEGERTLLALSIADSDNIDRFDTYRIYENLQNARFSGMNLREKYEYLDCNIEKLNKFRSMEFATKTATRIWREKIGFQIEFFIRLEKQLKDSEIVSIA